MFGSANGHSTQLCEISQTNTFRSQQRHPGDHPTTLAGTQSVRLLDSELVHHLQGHDGRVPVGEMLGRAAGGSMAQGLNGQQVERIGELLILKLRVVQRHGRAHGVDEHACRLLGVVRISRQLISGLDAAQVRDFNGGRGSHVLSVGLPCPLLFCLKAKNLASVLRVCMCVCESQGTIWGSETRCK